MPLNRTKKLDKTEQQFAAEAFARRTPLESALAKVGWTDEAREAAAEAKKSRVSPFEPDKHEWVMKQINEASGRRNWSQLPNDFEHDAVKNVYQRIKPHFPAGAISHRIAASNASTFDELKEAIGTPKK